MLNIKRVNTRCHILFIQLRYSILYKMKIVILNLFLEKKLFHKSVY